MSNKNKNRQGIIYSTDPAFRIDNDEGDKEETLLPKQQDLRVWLEKNHRGGKEVSVIKNFMGSVDDMEKLCKELKTKCGTGGSVKDGDIIIQGDQRKKISELLAKMGYKFKLAGG
ncbi:MAG: translation initiation factor [Chitinophagales bacterium]|nr:translation initiation factor [Chitinophagales bacterium]